LHNDILGFDKNFSVPTMYNLLAKIPHCSRSCDVLWLIVFWLSVCRVWLSVPVQSTAWKTPLWNDLLCVEWDVKPYSLTQSFWLIGRHPLRWHLFISYLLILVDRVANGLKTGLCSTVYPYTKWETIRFLWYHRLERYCWRWH